MSATFCNQIRGVVSGIEQVLQIDGICRININVSVSHGILINCLRYAKLDLDCTYFKEV